MLINSLDHCSIRTTNLQETREFFVDILGLADGKRPDFPFPGAWLYTDSTAVIHLIGVDPDDPSGLLEYVGGETREKPCRAQVHLITLPFGQMIPPS